MGISKNFLLLGLLMILVITACRKKELEDEFYTWVDDPVIFDPDLIEPVGSGKCNNGKYDFSKGEGGVDCGGECVPCNFETRCLNVDRDEMTISGQLLGFKYEKKDDQAGNKRLFEYTQRSGGTNKFFFTVDIDALLSSERELQTVSSNTTVDSYFCHLSYNSVVSGDFNVVDDYTAYIVEENGEKYLTFCGVLFRNAAGNAFSGSGSFKLGE
jgi:hypothetical protein